MKLIDEHNMLREKEKILKERALTLKKKLSIQQSEERINTKLEAIVNKVAKTDRLDREMNEPATLIDSQKQPFASQLQLLPLTENIALRERKLKLVKIKRNVVFSWNYQKLP